MSNPIPGSYSAAIAADFAAIQAASVLPTTAALPGDAVVSAKAERKFWTGQPWPEDILRWEIEFADQKFEVASATSPTTVEVKWFWSISKTAAVAQPHVKSAMQTIGGGRQSLEKAFGLLPVSVPLREEVIRFLPEADEVVALDGDSQNAGVAHAIGYKSEVRAWRRALAARLLASTED